MCAGVDIEIGKQAKRTSLTQNTGHAKLIIHRNTGLLILGIGRPWIYQLTTHPNMGLLWIPRKHRSPDWKRGWKLGGMKILLYVQIGAFRGLTRFSSPGRGCVNPAMFPLPTKTQGVFRSQPGKFTGLPRRIPSSSPDQKVDNRWLYGGCPPLSTTSNQRDENRSVSVPSLDCNY